MATHAQHWNRDGEVGTHYRFDKAGDGIAMHAHANPQLRHDVRVLKGGVEIYGDIPESIGNHGDTLRFASHRLHEIVALVDGTEIVNVLIDPPPEQIALHHDTSSCTEPTLMGRLHF